jgi:hypothetical protein
MWVWPRRPQSHHTHRETHRALQPRQPRFTLPISTLDPVFLTTCRLLAGTDRPAQPAYPQQPHTARAPAGRHSPTGSRGFRPLNHRPPPLLHSSRGHRDPAGSAVPTDALRSPSTAGQPCISARQARRKSAIRRRSPPPTSSTCTRHTKRAELFIITTARCAGTLGTPPHRSEPAQRPCSRRNRKPFRAGGRVRPAGVRSGDNAAERTPNRRRSRRGRRSHQP